MSSTAEAPRPDRSTDPRGDEAALFATLHARVWRAVRRSVSGPDDVIDDACQTAWLKLLSRQPDRERSVYGWLITVATREAWRLCRDARRQAPLGNPPVDECPGVRCLWTAEPVAPDARLSAQERLAEVTRTLPERKRRLVGLRALGFSYRDVAAITGDSVRTVDRQLQRAERRLDALREPLFG
jgi:RNA polymerase sigma factor (sigma-70 family)